MSNSPSETFSIPTINGSLPLFMIDGSTARLINEEVFEEYFRTRKYLSNSKYPSSNLLFSARYFVIDGEFIIDGPRPGNRAIGYKVITPLQFVLFRNCLAFASFIMGDVLLAKHYLA